MNKKYNALILLMFILSSIFMFNSCSKIRNLNPPVSTCNGNECHVSTILAKTVRSKGKHDVHTKRFKCENCHYNYFTHSNHQNGIDDIISNSNVVSFDELNPNTVWNNSTKDCSLIDCHGGAAGLINWYAAGSGCTSCHSTAQGSRRVILGAGGDFARTSHHVTGGIQDSDCKVCHDQSNHMGGTVRLLDVDTGVGSNFNISTLNNFCLSCHDSNGANGNFTPFSDGKTVPDVEGAAGSLWADSAHNTRGYAENGGNSVTCYGDGVTSGCHGNAHGSDNIKLIAGANFGGSLQTFCFRCHTEGRVMNDAISNNRPGGYVSADDIQEAFGKSNKHDLGSAFGSGFILQCTSCHNPHVVTGKYWEADSGKSSITRPDFSDSINNPRAMGKTLWGAIAGEKMDDYAATGPGSGGWYFSTARGGTISFDQGGKYQPPKSGSGYSFEYSGKYLPNYASFCLDCHQNDMGGNTQGAVNWSGDQHGLSSANTPAYISDAGKAGFWGSSGNPDVLFQMNYVTRGRGNGHFMRWPFDSAERSAGINFVLSCTDCHEAHGSNRGGFIRERFNVNANGDCGTGGNTNPDGENCRDGGNWNGFCNVCHYYYGGQHGNGVSCGNASCHERNSIHRIKKGGSSGSTRLQLTANGNQDNYVAPDFTPDILSVNGAVGSNQLTVTFRAGVYTNMDLSGALIPEDFRIFDKNGDNPKTIISVSHNAGDDTAILTLSAPLIVEDLLYDTVAVSKWSIWNWYDGGYNNFATGIIGAQAVSAGPYPNTISLSSACPPGNIFFPLNEGAGAPYTFDDQFSLIGAVGAPATAFTGDGYFHGDSAQATYIDFTNSAGCLLNIAGTGFQQKVTIEAEFKTNDVDLDYDGPGDQFPGVDSTFNRIVERKRTFKITVMRADYAGDNTDARAGQARIEVKYRAPAAYRRTCTEVAECAPDTAPCDGKLMKQVSTDIDNYPIVSNHRYRMRVVFNSTKTQAPIDIWVDDKGTDGNDAGELWPGYINTAKPDPVDSGGCRWMALPGDEMESENQLTYIGSPPNHNAVLMFDGLIDWVLWKPDADYTGVDDGPHY